MDKPTTQSEAVPEEALDTEQLDKVSGGFEYGGIVGNNAEQANKRTEVTNG